MRITDGCCSNVMWHNINRHGLAWSYSHPRTVPVQTSRLLKSHVMDFPAEEGDRYVERLLVLQPKQSICRREWLTYVPHCWHEYIHSPRNPSYTRVRAHKPHPFGAHCWQTFAHANGTRQSPVFFHLFPIHTRCCWRRGQVTSLCITADALFSRRMSRGARFCSCSERQLLRWGLSSRFSFLFSWHYQRRILHVTRRVGFTRDQQSKKCQNDGTDMHSRWKQRIFLHHDGYRGTPPLWRSSDGSLRHKVHCINIMYRKNS